MCTPFDLLEFRRDYLRKPHIFGIEHLFDFNSGLPLDVSAHPYFSYENRMKWVVREHFKDYILMRMTRSMEQE